MTGLLLVLKLLLGLLENMSGGEALGLRNRDGLRNHARLRRICLWNHLDLLGLLLRHCDLELLLELLLLLLDLLELLGTGLDLEWRFGLESCRGFDGNNICGLGLDGMRL